MAVGLTPPSALLPIAGLRLGTAKAGIRRADRRDLVLIECALGTEVAATFTQNRFCAAPVIIAREHLAAARPRALLINTGFANAGTGSEGIADAKACCASAAQALGVSTEGVLPFSTGVIGERIPVAKLQAAIPAAVSALTETGWLDAAQGIMTTDTVAKGRSCQVEIDGNTVTLTGIIKGAGMICPNMATLLAFVGTDANIAGPALQAALRTAVAVSLNRITVDGDTSTNDACVLLATGRAGNTRIVVTNSEAYATFAEALTALLRTLAEAVIRDAEGATKFMTIDVRAATSEADALAVAYTVAHSPLVKTAFFASDPNWGRILAAIGRAPIAALVLERVNVYLDEVCIVRNGARAADYTEAKGVAVMARPEITVGIELGAGNRSARVWTSDLSYDYVRINAEYRS